MKPGKSTLFKAFFILFILFGAANVYGQTPELLGWHSQTPLQMSKSDCFEKAKRALSSVGLTKQFALDNWTASGVNYNVRAGISCVSCGNGVHVSVGVAATNGYSEANTFRDRLRDYMLQGELTVSPSGQSSITNLAGQWTYAGTRGKINATQFDMQVRMEFSIKPRTTPAPHYVVNARINGNMLEGTWEFTVENDPKYSGSNCKGGKFYAEIGPDKNKITVLSSTEDPCNHVWAGTVFYRQ